MFAHVCSIKIEVCKAIIQENQEQSSNYEKRLNDLRRIHYRAKNRMPISIEDKAIVKMFPKL
jgi:hypothetical protein